MSRKEKAIKLRIEKDEKSMKKERFLSFEHIPKSSLQPCFLDKLFGEKEDTRSETKQKERKGEFAQEYKKNLRRTVYNETKLMLQTKKEGIFKQDKEQMNKKQQRGMFQTKSKKLAVDSLYKTIKSRRSSELKRKNNFSLGVNKFPLVARNNRQKFIQDSFDMRLGNERRQKIKKQNSSFGHFEKQDIQPWETMQPHY